MNARLDSWLGTLPDQYKSYRKPEHLLSMTMPLELCFCESYARDCFSGEGEMVDLGCWYGATTCCLARGLTQNQRAKRNRRIEAFDLFVWQPWMGAVKASTRLSVNPKPGESFFDKVQDLMRPYGEIVHLHQQDLMTCQPSQELIEFLFVDAMKSWPLAQRIVTSFFPRLIPGVSILVQQDFAYHLPICATNHLIMWRLRDYFEWVHHVPHSGSVVFLNTKRILREYLPDLSVESFTLAEIDQAYDYSLQCVPAARGRPAVEGAKLLFLIEQGYYEAAFAQAERLLRNKTDLTEKIINDGRLLIEAHRRAPKGESSSADNEGCENKLKILAEVEGILEALGTARAASNISPGQRRWRWSKVRAFLPRLTARGKKVKDG